MFGSFSQQAEEYKSGTVTHLKIPLSIFTVLERKGEREGFKNDKSYGTSGGSTQERCKHFRAAFCVRM